MAVYSFFLFSEQVGTNRSDTCEHNRAVDDALSGYAKTNHDAFAPFTSRSGSEMSANDRSYFICFIRSIFLDRG